MRKRSGQVHSRESSATLQLTVSLLYLFVNHFLRSPLFDDMLNMVIFLEGEGLVWQAVY